MCCSGVCVFFLSRASHHIVLIHIEFIISNSSNSTMFETPTDITLTKLVEVLQILLELDIDQTTIDNLGPAGLRSYLQTKRPSASYPRVPPQCFRCLEPATKYFTNMTNSKGNGGRPCFKCGPCDQFLVFADARGNDPQRDHCVCGFPTKRMIVGKDTENHGQVFYVCSQGTCGYYVPRVDDNTQRAIKIDPGLKSQLVELYI
ncbi:hypothetical protein F4815DRAFT_455899, partial [Daldinia loculata]